MVGSPSNYDNAYFEVQSVRVFGASSAIEVREFGTTSAIEIPPDEPEEPPEEPSEGTPSSSNGPPPDASSASRKIWFTSVTVLFGVALATLVSLVAL